MDHRLSYITILRARQYNIIKQPHILSVIWQNKYYLEDLYLFKYMLVEYLCFYMTHIDIKMSGFAIHHILTYIMNYVKYTSNVAYTDTENDPDPDCAVV